MKLYLHCISMLLRSRMQYKASFVMLTLSQFLTSFSAFLGIWFLFDRFHTVRGFELEEVLLCAATVLTAFSLTECFARGFDRFPNLIRTGELDRMLLRPRSVFFQVLTSDVELTRMGRLLQAVLMLTYAIPNSGVVWTPDKIVTLCLMLLGGVGVFSGLFILYAGISFFTIEGLEFMNILTCGGNEFGAYPMSVYGESVRRLFTYVVPVTLFQYYPLLYLLGRSERVWYMLLPLVCMLFPLPCTLLFRFGLRRYRSTGS